jgi:hypothetical protein
MTWNFGYAIGTVALAFVGIPIAIAVPTQLGITDAAGRAVSGDTPRGAVEHAK